jgi:dihydrolipoamide dehydrogenase
MAGKTKIVIIGGGPGGYVAAIRASQLDADVTLVEKNRLGGTCLNIGCIPTKAILHSAEAIDAAKHMGDLGINVEVKGIDWKKVIAKKVSITNTLVGGVQGLLKMGKVKVIEGEATFTSKDAMEVTKKDGSKEKLTWDKLILATGSIPSTPPIPGVKDNPCCVDSTGALAFETLPKSLVVVGGGVIGVELASAYAMFGTKVTIVEALPRLLLPMDGELTAQLRKIMEKSGIAIYTEAKVASVEKAGNEAKVIVDYKGKKESFTAEKVLVAVGRRTNVASLNLAKAGIAEVKGHITVNEKQETNVKNIYAIGDCSSKLMLAHVAMVQGEIAAANALGGNEKYDAKTSPACVYAEQEFAGVGMTEEQVKEAKIPYLVGKFPLSGNGKALITNGGVGTVKYLIGKEYHELLGVHILGARATDLIGECALCIGMEGTVEDIIATIHSHPTITEAVREGALASLGRCIHMPNKKK